VSVHGEIFTTLILAVLHEFDDQFDVYVLQEANKVDKFDGKVSHVILNALLHVLLLLHHPLVITFDGKFNNTTFVSFINCSFVVFSNIVIYGVLVANIVQV